MVSQIDAILEKCLIRFEDSSLYWIRFDDLHKQLSVGSVMADSDILCAICRDGRSHESNEIVLCDVCNQGYHQRCHKPRIGDEILEPDVPWTCRLCVFALGTKEGGAERNGLIGRVLKCMKSELPYDLSALHWDEEHQTNREQTYCYCGGNGNYYSKMLQCCQCHQWFHEACIQALETPLLYGDHYYTFKCAVCAKGKEQLKRIIMKWSDMIALVINNLALQHQKRFFELSTDIVPFIQNNSTMLKMSEDILKLTERELQDRISTVLKNNTNRFINGKEMRKKAGYWALRLPFPFEKPLIFAPPLALQSSLSPVPSVSPSLSPTSTPVPSGASPAMARTEPSEPQSESHHKFKTMAHMMFGACRKGASKYPLLNSDPLKRPQQSSRSNSVSSSTTSTISRSSVKKSVATKKAKPKQTTEITEKRPVVAQKTSSVTTAVKRPKSGSKQTTKKFAKTGDDSSDTEMISMPTIESLDAIIPVPKDFEGHNNPFCDTKANLLKGCLSKGADRMSTSTETDPLAKTSLPLADTLGLMGQNDQKFNILAQRVKPDGKVEYLLEWQN